MTSRTVHTKRMEAGLFSPRWLRVGLRAWLPVLLAVAVISFESTRALGAEHTREFLRSIGDYLFGSSQMVWVDRWNFFLRKGGHFTGYALIALVWLRAWRMTFSRRRVLWLGLLALAGTAMIASCDEWHQTFLANRTGSVHDVLLDCSGAMLALMIAYVVYTVRVDEEVTRLAL